MRDKTVGMKVNMQHRVDNRVMGACPPSHVIGSPIQMMRGKLRKIVDSCEPVFAVLRAANSVNVPVEMIYSESD